MLLLYIIFPLSTSSQTIINVIIESSNPKTCTRTLADLAEVNKEIEGEGVTINVGLLEIKEGATGGKMGGKEER